MKRVLTTPKIAPKALEPWPRLPGGAGNKTPSFSGPPRLPMGVGRGLREQMNWSTGPVTSTTVFPRGLLLENRYTTLRKWGFTFAGSTA